jgi:hypothetical protein
MGGWSCGKGCDCNGTLARLQEKLCDEEMVWKPDEVQAVEDVIYVTLCCVERHCPDPVFRMWASAQLIDPWWDKQRARDRRHER